MHQQTVWNRVESVLGDANGGNWADIRGIWSDSVSELAHGISQKNFSCFLSRICELSSRSDDDKYYFFGYGLLSMLLNECEYDHWIGSSFLDILRSVAVLEKENDRVVALVGNRFWPGVTPYFHCIIDAKVLETCYANAIKIIQTAEDDHMLSVGYERILQGSTAGMASDWFAGTVSEVLRGAESISTDEYRINAHAGLVSCLHEFFSEGWARQQYDHAYEVCSELSPHPESKFSDSLKVKLAIGMSKALLECRSCEWSQAQLERLVATVNQIPQPLYRAKAVAALADACDSLSDTPALHQWIDSLTEIGAAVPDEEAQVKALVYSVKSVGSALTTFSSNAWAKERIEALAERNSEITTPEVRAEYIGNLCQAVAESSDQYWASSTIQNLLNSSIEIAQDEARGDALVEIAEAVATLEDDDSKKDLFEHLFSLTAKICDVQHATYSLLGKHGIIASALRISPMPDWACKLAIKGMKFIESIESPLHRAVALNCAAETQIPLLSSDEHLPDLLSTLFGTLADVDTPDALLHIYEGICSGSSSVKDSNTRDQCTELLLHFSGGLSDEILSMQTTAIVLKELFGVRCFQLFDSGDHKDRAREHLGKILAIARGYSDPESSAALLAGPCAIG